MSFDLPSYVVNFDSFGKIWIMVKTVLYENKKVHQTAVLNNRSDGLFLIYLIMHS